MKRKLCTFLIAATLFAMTVTGCAEEYIPVDTETDTIRSTTAEDGTKVDIPKLTQALPVKGESFSLVCKYDTGKYPLRAGM